MTQTTQARLKTIAAFLAGFLSFGVVIASGIFEGGKHSAKHEALDAHVVKSDALVERFVMTEQVVKNIDSRMNELILEVREIRKELRQERMRE